MQNSLRLIQDVFSIYPFTPAATRSLGFSEEIDAQRRRKGSGPQGRAEAPVYRQDGGSSGGGPSFGGRPSLGGGGGGCSRMPLWLIIVVFVLLLIFGGKGVIGQLLGGSADTVPPAGQAPISSIDTAIPDEQSAPLAGFTPPAGSKSGSWTVMLYQDADDQVLEQDVFTDFNEAERVGSTDAVHIVAQLDRFRGAYTGDGNWTCTRRYYVTQDNDLNAIHSQLVADLGEANMSDPATLVDFAAWAVQTFPADHYVLILSDHGMGWPGGWTDPAPAINSTESAPIAQVVGNAMYLDQVDAPLGRSAGRRALKNWTSLAWMPV